MYNHEVTLIGQTYERDEWGNQKPIETRTTVLCRLQSVGRAEFYGAAQANLRPEIVLIVKGYEYSGEKEVEFEDRRYKVIRTYGEDFEELELVLGEAGGVG